MRNKVKQKEVVIKIKWDLENISVAKLDKLLAKIRDAQDKLHQCELLIVKSKVKLSNITGEQTR